MHRDDPVHYPSAASSRVQFAIQEMQKAIEADKVFRGALLEAANESFLAPRVVREFIAAVDAFEAARIAMNLLDLTGDGDDAIVIGED